MALTLTIEAVLSAYLLKMKDSNQEELQKAIGFSVIHFILLVFHFICLLLPIKSESTCLSRLLKFQS